MPKDPNLSLNPEAGMNRTFVRGGFAPRAASLMRLLIGSTALTGVALALVGPASAGTPQWLGDGELEHGGCADPGRHERDHRQDDAEYDRHQWRSGGRPAGYRRQRRQRQSRDHERRRPRHQRLRLSRIFCQQHRHGLHRRGRIELDRRCRTGGRFVGLGHAHDHQRRYGQQPWRPRRQLRGCYRCRHGQRRRFDLDQHHRIGYRLFRHRHGRDHAWRHRDDRRTCQYRRQCGRNR